MATIDPDISIKGTIWQCDNCHIWWGSQVDKNPLTLFLLRLPGKITETLNWVDYRGWKSAHPQPSSCPLCNQKIAKATYSVS